MESGHLGLIPATDADLLSCAREQIHTPGAIQPHGALLAARMPDLRVTHASQNLGSVLGVEAAGAIGLPLGAVIGQAACEAMVNAVSNNQTLAVVVFSITLPVLDGSSRSFLVHRLVDVLMIEIEASEATAPDAKVLDAAQSAMIQMRKAKTLEALSDFAVREIQDRTGYDRVMVYRFDQEGHGEVIAEARRDGLTPYLHLRYPASDIPPQARRLYLMARLRMIPQLDYAPAPILADAALAGAAPLDLSHCTLRSVSPIHCEYMRNMGVGASLTISVIQDQQLWGMIVCHHAGRLLTPQPVRAFCDLIGQLFGLMVAEVGERERVAAMLGAEAILAEITNKLDTGDSIFDGLAPVCTELLKLVNAAGAFLRLAGVVQTIGETPPAPIAAAILDALRTQNSDEITTFENLSAVQPQFLEFKAVASGVLCMPLANNFGDGIIWFRPEVVRSVKWGGDPREKALLEPVSQRISPRKSFAAWQEILEGHSTPWTEEEVRAAGNLRRVLTRALLRHTEAELFRISNSDPLTGLANRAVLNQHIAQWQSAKPARPAALLLFDLDRFKTVNDSLGHYAGDDLLREAARRLTGIAGGEQLLVRYGGDEFVIFRPGCSAEEAWELTQAVLRVFEEPFIVAGRPYRATTSVGLAYTLSGEQDFLREADAAMYAAKRQGGNRAVLFRPELHESARNRLRTEQDLFFALQRGEISVHYQPIVRLPKGNLRLFEALARWHHPERGFISPAEFIPLAEETGHIIPIGKFVAETAIKALAALGDDSLHMSINVSGGQLLTGSFSEELKALSAAHGVALSRLTIEVTESILMAEDAVLELENVRRLGCRIAIDDFGMGYSSLAYLRRLPVDVVKIDRSFVSPLDTEPQSEAFLRAIVRLAQTLRLEVVAEGVETEAQARILAGMSCEAAQGYYFGRPSPVCAAAFVPKPVAL